MPATSPATIDEQTLLRAHASVRWWPAALATLGLGIFYALVSDRLTLGPPWVVLVVMVVSLIVARILSWRGLLAARRWVTLAALAAVTLSLTVSVGFLVVALVNHTAEALDLLKGGALLWVSNILTFGLWYWETDGGGPAHRHAMHVGSSDFAFPQEVLSGENQREWMPDFLDYVFLAFNTNTAFSPTDTLVLARRAKLLMMYQSLVSLVTVAVLVARAINAI